MVAMALMMLSVNEYGFLLLDLGLPGVGRYDGFAHTES